MHRHLQRFHQRKINEDILYDSSIEYQKIAKLIFTLRNILPNMTTASSEIINIVNSYGTLQEK